VSASPNVPMPRGCDGKTALVIMTPWREFSSYSPAQIRDGWRAELVIDPFGAAMDADDRRKGFILSFGGTMIKHHHSQHNR